MTCIQVDLQLCSLSSHYRCGWNSGLISLLLGTTKRSRSLSPHLQDTEDGNATHQSISLLRLPCFHPPSKSVSDFCIPSKDAWQNKINKPYSCIQIININVKSHHCKVKMDLRKFLFRAHSFWQVLNQRLVGVPHEELLYIVTLPWNWLCSWLVVPVPNL